MNTIKINCCYCNNEFDKAKNEYTRQTKEGNFNFFCSKECYRQKRLSQPIKLICPECNKNFTSSPRSYRKKLKINIKQLMFCSKQCANICLGRNRSPETKEKLRSASKEWCKNNYEKLIQNAQKGFETLRKQGKYFCSKGEIEVFEYIKNNVPELLIQTGGGFGIGYVEGKLVRKQFDIFCKETKTIIEYDGICHFKPIYGKPSFDKTIFKDTLLKKWCSENGWSLIRIKEEVYKRNKENMLKILIGHIKNTNQELIEYYVME